MADTQPDRLTAAACATEPVTGHPALTLGRNRDFLLLWSGQAVSTVGGRVANLAYPLLVLALTGSPAKAGLVGFALALAGPVWYLPAGAIVDRWNRKTVMVLADTARLAAVTSLVLALLMGHPSLVQLLFVAFIEGSGGVFFQLAETAGLPQVVPRPQLSTAVAQNQARNLGAGLAGQPLGGLLYSAGQAAPFLANAVSYLVSLVTVLLIRPRLQAPDRPARQHLVADIGEGVVWLWRQPLLRSIAVFASLANFGFSALPLILIVRARQLGAGPITIGLMMGVTGGGAVLGAVLASRLHKRIPERVILLGTLWACTLLVVALATLSKVVLLGLATALATAQVPLLNVVSTSYRYALVPDRLIARVTSVNRLLSFGTIPLASLAAGLSLVHFGPTRSFLLAAGVLALSAAVATATAAVRNAAPAEDLAHPG